MALMEGALVPGSKGPHREAVGAPRLRKVARVIDHHPKPVPDRLEAEAPQYCVGRLVLIACERADLWFRVRLRSRDRRLEERLVRVGIGCPDVDPRRAS